jgi:hypothetical protein
MRSKSKSKTESCSLSFSSFFVLACCFNPYLEELSGSKLHTIKGSEWFTLCLPERTGGGATGHRGLAVVEYGDWSPLGISTTVRKSSRAATVKEQGKPLPHNRDSARCHTDATA